MCRAAWPGWQERQVRDLLGRHGGRERDTEFLVELEDIASFYTSAVETKADKMTGVMLGCNGVCMFNEKEKMLRMVLLKLSPWAKFLGS